jgi:UDP-GlcNAc:undecaprenyl-phosphate/decaprenyl-phosphate GlcNAc-1-phosphate transferase
MPGYATGGNVRRTSTVGFGKRCRSLPNGLAPCALATGAAASLTLVERLVAGFVLAGGLAYLATPYAIVLADRMQFYDKPAGYKGHLQPTPYLGGVAVVAGLVLAVGLTAGSWDKTAPLLAGVLLLCAIGTIDDRRSLSPAVRVLVELALGALVWAVGLGWHLHAGAALDLVVTCAWVVVVVNAFNLFDNMDGAASAMGLVVAAGAALIAVVRGDLWLAAAAASLSGACLGFLPRNISTPARIFLGDGGSMPLGFAVAVVVMKAAGSSPTAWRSLLVGLLLVGVPILDTSLVIVSRRRRGVSVLLGGRDHLTHRAHTLLGSTRAVALALGVVQAALSAVAVLASRGEAGLVVFSASAYLLAAGAAIVVLDSRRPEEFGPLEERSGVSPRWFSKRALVCIVLLGLGAGLSPFLFAYYDASVWVPVGLGVTLLCVVGLVMSPLRPGAPAALALLGVLGLGVWSLFSTAWAESVENAVVSGNRWLALGAVLLLMLVLVSHDRRAAVLLGACALGIAAVAVSVLVRLLGSAPGTLFLGGRLNSPLGYINGEGCLFAMGIWPFVALAQTRRPSLAAAGAATAALCAALAVLSQSRGTALAVLGSLLVVVALLPGRTRRLYALLVLGGAVAIAAPELLHVYDRSAGGAVSATDAHAAGRAALLAALGAGVAWGLSNWAWNGVSGRPYAPVLARLGSWLLALLAVAALLLAAMQPVGHDVRRQWHAFVHLGEPGENRAPGSVNSRLLTGAGNRYDYWRIAWEVWREHPVLGVGAGNYARPYYRRRATAEDIDQPHSVELQALSELGLVGLLLLACLFVGVAWGAVRARRRVGGSELRLAIAICGLGMFTAWLLQASVDWMHLLPGLTAIAFAGAAALLWPRASAVPAAAERRAGEGEGPPLGTGRRARRRTLVAAGVSALVATLIATGASLSRQGLGDIYRSRAQDELSVRPAAALRDANRSLKIDSDSIRTYYIKAAALARFDQASAAEAVLSQALVREPRNFVTWALLGDIAVRERRLALARLDYMRAHRLNPRDAVLSQLAHNARSALR